MEPNNKPLPKLSDSVRKLVQDESRKIVGDMLDTKSSAIVDELFRKFMDRVNGEELSRDVYERVSANLRYFGGQTAQDPIRADLAGTPGSSLVSFIQSGTGTVATTVSQVLSERISIFRWFTAAQIADVQSGNAPTIDVTTAVSNAFSYIASHGGTLYIPRGRYLISTVTGLTITWANKAFLIIGDGFDVVDGGAQFECPLSSGSALITLAGASGIHHCWLLYFALKNTSANAAWGLRLNGWRECTATILGRGFTGAKGTAGVIYNTALNPASVNDVSEFNHFIDCYNYQCAHTVFTDLAGANNIDIIRGVSNGNTQASIYAKWQNHAIGESFFTNWNIDGHKMYPASGLTDADILCESGAKRWNIKTYNEDNDAVNPRPLVQFSTGHLAHAGISINGEWMQGYPVANHGIIEIGNCSGLDVGGITWTSNTAGGAGLVRFLDASVTNYEITYPGLASGAALPHTLIKSDATTDDRQTVTDRTISANGLITANAGVLATGGAVPGVGSAAVMLWSSGNFPFINLIDPSQTANNRVATWYFNGGTLVGTFQNDAQGASVDWVTVTGGQGSGLTSIAWKGRSEEKQGALVNAANNLALGKDGNYFQIGGATQINLIDNTNWQGGSVITLKFNSTPTVKHNQAASGNNKPIILNGAVDLVAAASNTLTLRYDSTDSAWYEQSRKV